MAKKKIIYKVKLWNRYTGKPTILRRNFRTHSSAKNYIKRMGKTPMLWKKAAIIRKYN